MILNQELDFKNVSPEIQAAFVGRQAKKKLFDVGHQLFKFTLYPLVSNGKVTAWWSSVLPANNLDTGLAELLKRTERMGVDSSQFAGARNAVTHQWNSMNGLLLAALNVSVYGFVGQVAHQRFDTHANFENVFFIGGATQLWIPNLTNLHVRQA